MNILKSFFVNAFYTFSVSACSNILEKRFEEGKKARKRQLNEDYPKLLLSDIRSILESNIGQDEIVNKLNEYVKDYDGWFFNK